MSKFIVNHCQSLSGTVKISGSKNAVLPILAATLLTEDICHINNVPPLQDVCVMVDILKRLGASISFQKEKESIESQAQKIEKFEEDYDLAVKMRASFLIMGPLLARFGKAKIPLPGGCPIGTRPVDLHLKGLTALGAKLKQEHGFIEIKAKKLLGNSIYLDFPSVGATENIMMAASLAEGKTIIENAAAEPEIIDLSNFLNEMGAQIEGAGTDTIIIQGVEKLHGTSHTIIADRIEAGTFMVAAAITRGDILLENVNSDHLKPIIAKLEETHIKSESFENKLHIYPTGRLTNLSIKTMPFPGFPTDMQAPFMALLTVCEGTSMITETVFENRFLHAGELKRMGANIKIDSRSAVIEGVKKLTGTQVRATDLRAGAALIISALIAEGQTEISDIFHIERGYYKIEDKLQKLGVKIDKVEDTDN